MRLFKSFHTPTFVSVSIDDIDNAEDDDNYTKVFVVTPTKTYVRHDRSPSSPSTSNNNSSNVKWPSLKLRKGSIKSLTSPSAETPGDTVGLESPTKHRSRWTFPSRKKAEHIRNISLPTTYSPGEISPKPRMSNSKAMNLSLDMNDLNGGSKSPNSKRPPFLDQSSESRMSSTVRNVSHSMQKTDIDSVGYMNEMSQTKLFAGHEPETNSNEKTFGNLYITLGASEELLPPIEPAVPLTEGLENELGLQDDTESGGSTEMRLNGSALFQTSSDEPTAFDNNENIKVYSKVYSKNDWSRRSDGHRDNRNRENESISTSNSRSVQSGESDYLQLPPRSEGHRLSRRDIYELEKSRAQVKSGDIVRQSVKRNDSKQPLTSPLPSTPPELTYDAGISFQEPPDAVMKHVMPSEGPLQNDNLKHDIAAEPRKATYDWVDIASNIDTIQSSLNMCDQEYLTHQIENMLSCPPHHGTTSSD